MIKYLLTLLACCLLSLVSLNAQTKSQVLSDINQTLMDFSADLNSICEDDEPVESHIRSISEAFGSDEYFIFNGKKMESFQDWLRTYYKQELKDKEVTHSFQVKQQTIVKVAPDEDSDKRYRFDALLTRTSGRGNPTPQTVSFVVCWNGEGRYATILESRGDWGLDMVGINKVGNKHWAFKFPWRLWVYGLYIFILGGIIVCVFDDFCFRDSLKIIVYIILFILCSSFFIVKIVCNSKNDTQKMLQSYDVFSRVDSLDIAWVRQNDKIGMIDYNGNLVLDYQFTEVGKFVDGLAWVNLGTRIGYVDGDGDVIVQPLYTFAQTYRNGLALVGNETGYAVINTEGKTLRTINADMIDTFYEGKAVFRRDGMYGYFSEWSYMEAIPAAYTSADRFKDGLAIVAKNKLMGCIDHKGIEVIPVKYQSVMRDGNYFIVKQNGKYGLMDKTGKIVVPVNCEYIRLLDDKKAQTYRNGVTKTITLQ